MTSPFTDEPHEPTTPTRNYGMGTQFTMGYSTPGSSSSTGGPSSPESPLEDYFARSPFSPYAMEGVMDSPSRGRKRRGRRSVHEYPLTLSPVLEPSHGPDAEAPTRTTSSRRGSSSSLRGISPWGQAARGSSSRAKLVHEGSRARRPYAPLLWPMAVDGGSSPELSATELRKERRSWSATSSSASAMTPPPQAHSPPPLLLDDSEVARHGVHAELRQLNDWAAGAYRASDIAKMYPTGKQKAKARGPSDVRPPGEDKVCLIREIDVLKARFRAKSEDGTPERASQPPPSVKQSSGVSRPPSQDGPSNSLHRSASERQTPCRPDCPSQEMRRSRSAHRPSFPQQPQQGSEEQEERELIAMQLLQLQLSQAQARQPTPVDSPPQASQSQALVHLPLGESQSQALVHLPLGELESQALVHLPHGPSQAQTSLHPPLRASQPQQQHRRQFQSQQQASQRQLQLQQQGSQDPVQPEQQPF
ncbi:hypothetical protein V8C26DRAFT_296339 [Trichoderma gracile]